MTDVREFGGTASSRFFVFMGVCGAGKSTVAEAVADALACDFLEADDLHPPENVKAMSEGRPLTDEQRWPWLEAVCRSALARNHELPVMIACSALARRYRDFIRERLPGVVFIHLHGTPDIIHQRMMRRPSHFMPPDLLESQLATLEPTLDEPDCHNLNIDGAQDAVIAQAISICGRHIVAMPQGAPAAPKVNRTEAKDHQRRKGYV